MGRYYRLSKKISKEEAKQIVTELKEIKEVKKAQILDKNSCLLVDAEDDKYTQIMGAAVNICSRVASVELSFERFDY